MFGIFRFGIVNSITYQKFKKIHDVNDLSAKNKSCYMRYAFFTLLGAFNTHTHTIDAYMEAYAVIINGLFLLLHASCITLAV